MSQEKPKRRKSSGAPPASRRLVAVDFDSRQIRLVQAERSGGGVRIVRIVGQAAPDGMDLADPKAVGGLLRSALKDNRLAGWPVVMCVPRGLAVLKTLAFPPATRDAELAGMVQYQVEKELPFRPEEAVVDFTTESHFHAAGPAEQAGGARVLVAAVRVPVVDYYRQIALAAGAKLLRLGLRPYANQRCFTATMGGDSTEKCALVHITADETEIDVVVGESLAFSRSALGKVPRADKATPAEMAEAAAGVVAEIVRSLQSYQSVEGGGKVDQVCLAGGTGLEPLVAKELSERLGMRCQMFSPAEAMKLGARGGASSEFPSAEEMRPGAPSSTASEFISALGLAVASGAMPIDLLHPKRPAPPRNTRRTRVLVGAAAAVVLLLASVAAGNRYLGAKRARRDALQADYHKLEARKKGMDANAARAATVEAWEKKGQNWLDHFALLSAKFPSAQNAYTGAISSNEDGSLTFTVYASNEQTITDITKRLEGEGYDATADKQGKNNDARYPYTASMKVRPGPDMEVDLSELVAVPRPEDDLGPGEAAPVVRRVPPAAAAPTPAGNPGGGMGGGNVGGGRGGQGNPTPAGNPGGGGNRGGMAGGGGGRGGMGNNPNPARVILDPGAGTRDPNRFRGGRRGGGP